MPSPDPHATSREQRDPDGVRVVRRDGAARRTRVAYQGLAMFLVAGCVGYALTPPAAAPRNPARTTAPPPVSATDREAMKALEDPAGEPAAQGDAAAAKGGAAVQAAASSRRALTPRRLASPRQDGPPPDLTPEQQQLAEKLKAEGRTEMKAGEYIQALHDAGIYEGIGAFNPPGTMPPLEGLAVPEDYELPEGFVRHYQATDDGQPIEPILMFHPDYEFFDANGNPIPIPENRVVPPEYVPPGFPIRAIEIPAERRPGDVSR